VGADLIITGGRPKSCVKQRATAAQGPTAVRSQASIEGSAEITSGRANFQQGLAATCKDLVRKVNPRHREDFGLAHELV